MQAVLYCLLTIHIHNLHQYVLEIAKTILHEDKRSLVSVFCCRLLDYHGFARVPAAALVSRLLSVCLVADDSPALSIGDVFCRWLLSDGTYTSLAIRGRLVVIAFGRTLAFALARALSGSSLASNTPKDCHGLREDELLHSSYKMHSHKLQRSRNAGHDHRTHGNPAYNATTAQQSRPIHYMHHAMPMFSQSAQPAHVTSLIAAQVQLAIMQRLQHKHPDRKARLGLLAHMAYDAARKGKESRRSTCQKAIPWFCQSSDRAPESEVNCI